MSRGLEPKPYSSLSLASTYGMTRSWRVYYQEKLRPILRDLIRKFYPTLEYRIKLKQFFGVEYLYDLLADFRSKELLVKLFAFRAMGPSQNKIASKQSRALGQYQAHRATGNCRSAAFYWVYGHNITTA